MAHFGFLLAAIVFCWLLGLPAAVGAWLEALLYLLVLYAAFAVLTTPLVGLGLILVFMGALFLLVRRERGRGKE